MDWQKGAETSTDFIHHEEEAQQEPDHKEGNVQI